MKQPRTGKDQRQFRRIAVTATVRYAPRQFGSDVPPDLWEGCTVDVSRSGAALRLPHRLRRGGLVELSLIQESPPRCVTVVGQVVRCERTPGAPVAGSDSTPRPAYLVAVQFTRVLGIEELALLREGGPPDATEVERRRQT